MKDPLQVHYEHRIEHLEAAVRKYRQAVRVLSEVVIAGEDAKNLACVIQKMLETDEVDGLRSDQH